MRAGFPHALPRHGSPGLEAAAGREKAPQGPQKPPGDLCPAGRSPRLDATAGARRPHRGRNSRRVFSVPPADLQIRAQLRAPEGPTGAAAAAGEILYPAGTDLHAWAQLRAARTPHRGRSSRRVCSRPVGGSPPLGRSCRPSGGPTGASAAAGCDPLPPADLHAWAQQRTPRCPTEAAAAAGCVPAPPADLYDQSAAARLQEAPQGPQQPPGVILSLRRISMPGRSSWPREGHTGAAVAAG